MSKKTEDDDTNHEIGQDEDMAVATDVQQQDGARGNDDAPIDGGIAEATVQNNVVDDDTMAQQNNDTAADGQQQQGDNASQHHEPSSSTAAVPAARGTNDDRPPT